MSVTDGDEPHSPAWNAKFKIVDGDPGGLFTVKTGSNKHEGIISTAKVGSKYLILCITSLSSVAVDKTITVFIQVEKSFDGSFGFTAE